MPRQDQLIIDYLEDARYLLAEDKDPAYAPKFFSEDRFTTMATLLERGESAQFIQRSMLKELVKRIGQETGGIITETEVTVVEVKTTEPAPKEVTNDEPQQPGRLNRAISAIASWWLRMADEGRHGTLIDEENEEDELAAIVLPYMQLLPEDKNSAASLLETQMTAADVSNRN